MITSATKGKLTNIIIGAVIKEAKDTCTAAPKNLQSRSSQPAILTQKIWNCLSEGEANLRASYTEGTPIEKQTEKPDKMTQKHIFHGQLHSQLYPKKKRAAVLLS
jgi:hypothetical protein